MELSEITLNNDKVGGDIFSAIEFCIWGLNSHCGTKKYNKRIFLFSNGKGKTKVQRANFRKIVSDIKNNDIKLNIIPMDFMETYDYEENSLDG